MSLPVPTIVFGLIATLIVFAFFSIFIRNNNASNNSSPRGINFVPVSVGRSSGLASTLINTFPTFLYSEVKFFKIGKCALECAVCLNEFEDDETLRLLPKCDHVFHPECIDAWLASHATCPVCRASLTEPDGHDSEPPIPAAVSAESNTDTDEISVTIQVAEEAVDDRSDAIRSSSIWSKYPRSHSTGHSLVRPVENMERFTLNIPDQFRLEIMTRAMKLNRTTSLNSLGLPRETSSRKGYRESYRRLGSLDRSDRWMFTMALPFLARDSSTRKSNRSSGGSEGTSKGFNLLGRLPFNRFGSSKSSEPGLV